MEKTSQKKEKTANTITRRSFIKKTTTLGLGVYATAGMGPWFIKDALSSSGSLNLYTWPDYSKAEVIKAFEKSTGIKVKVTNYSSNQECMNKLRAARAKGFDIAQPSMTEIALHMEFELYKTINESKIPNLKNLEPSFYDSPKKQGGVVNGNRVGMPYNWAQRRLPITPINSIISMVTYPMEPCGNLSLINE